MRRTDRGELVIPCQPGGALGQNRTRRYARNPTESLHIGVLGKMLDSDYIAEGTDGEIH